MTNVKEEVVVCQICCNEYTEERVLISQSYVKKQTQLQPCKHDLCYDCVHKSVIQKLICPFCQQAVTSAKTVDQSQQFFEDLDLLANVHAAQDLGDANPFLNYINHTFFIDDLEILNQIRIQTHDRMLVTLSYKDQFRFKERWFLYDQVSKRITETETIIFEELQMDPEVILKDIALMHRQLQALMAGNWTDSCLAELYRQYLVQERYTQPSDDEEQDIHQKFNVQTKSSKRKRKRK